MRYSCFNDRLRLYEVFEDRRGHPINGDLPIPSLPSQVGGIGVPATDAARSLPSGVRRVGTSWTPQGMIVKCKNQKVPGLGDDWMPPSSFFWPFVLGGALGALVSQLAAVAILGKRGYMERWSAR